MLVKLIATNFLHWGICAFSQWVGKIDTWTGFEFCSIVLIQVRFFSSKTVFELSRCRDLNEARSVMKILGNKQKNIQSVVTLINIKQVVVQLINNRDKPKSWILFDIISSVPATRLGDGSIRLYFYKPWDYTMYLKRMSKGEQTYLIT